MAVAIDFETYYSKKQGCSLTRMLPEHYCKHPLFEAYIISVCDGTNWWAGHPRDFNWNALAGQVVVSHNKRFDYTVWDEMMKQGKFPKINCAEFHCTANLSAYICNRRSLADAVSFLYNVTLDKSDRTNAESKHWPDDFSEAERTSMVTYARKDAYWCWKLWNDYSPKWPLLERRLSNLTIEQGRYGVKINRELLNHYIIEAHDMKGATEKVIPWIAESEDDEWEDFNSTRKPTSTKCIAEQCRRVGIACPPVKCDDPEGYDEWEALYAPKYPWIKAVSAWRSVNKLYKTFSLVKDRLSAEDTMPFDLLYFGAHTGRFAGAGKLNMQNPRKKPIFRLANGLMETDEIAEENACKILRQTGNIPAGYISALDFRRLIIPHAEKKMIVGDLSQVEPRCLAWLCGDTALLDKIRAGYGVYEAFARANFGWTGGSLKDEDPDQYNMTKIQVLALGYGAGWEKFIKIAAGWGVDLTKNDPEFITSFDSITGEEKQISGFGTHSKGIVANFRAKAYRIPALWKKLEEAFKRSIGGDFVIILPSGRSLTYRGVKATYEIKPDAITGRPRRNTVFTAEVAGRRRKMYGGFLTENLVQATARDLFVAGLLRIVDAGHRVLFSAHDEVVCEVDECVEPWHIKALMCQCPEWISELPIDADVKVVPFYCK